MDHKKKGRNELKRRTDKPITQIQLDMICWDILSKNLLRKRNIVKVPLFVIFESSFVQNQNFHTFGLGLKGIRLKLD